MGKYMKVNVFAKGVSRKFGRSEPCDGFSEVGRESERVCGLFRAAFLVAWHKARINPRETGTYECSVSMIGIYVRSRQSKLQPHPA